MKNRWRLIVWEFDTVIHTDDYSSPAECYKTVESLLDAYRVSKFTIYSLEV